MLKVVKLSKRIGDKEVVKEVSFEVREREFFAITGRPGSGKSTLLKMITGLITPDSGEIYLDGKRINELPPSRRGMSMVFENPPIYPDRTAYDNIAFPLKIKKLPNDQIRRRIDEVADRLEIKHILNRKPETFSGGEYQRVALARALVTSPRILILDEPLKNLDAKIREKMKVWLKKLQRDIGVTVIYVTFDPVEALSVGDRVGVMLNGKLEQVGAPLEVFNEPKSLSVAEFIGIPTINVFEGTITEENNQLAVRIRGKLVKLAVPSETIESLTGEREVIVGIRPEDIELKTRQDDKLMEGKTLFTQSLGSERLVTAEVYGRQVKAVVHEFEKPVGNHVWLKINKVYIFDKYTQRRLLTAKVAI